MLKIVIMLYLLLLPTITLAAIYKYTDTDGVITYSDQPQTKAKQVILPEANISKTPASQPLIGTQPNSIKTESTSDKDAQSTAVKNNNTNTEKTLKQEYTELTIASPSNQATFQNQPVIPVTVSVKPALQAGDTVTIYLDGKSVAAGAQTSFNIPKTMGDKIILTRGTHTIYAAIKDKNGKLIITSRAVTVYLHYTSI